MHIFLPAPYIGGGQLEVCCPYSGGLNTTSNEKASSSATWCWTWNFTGTPSQGKSVSNSS